MFMMSLPFALTRGAFVGIAVTCGFSVRFAGSTTVGNGLVGAIVAAVVWMAVGTTATTALAVRVAVGVLVLAGILVAGADEVALIEVTVGRFVFVGGSVATGGAFVAEGGCVAGTAVSVADGAAVVGGTD